MNFLKIKYFPNRLEDYLYYCLSNVVFITILVCLFLQNMEQNNRNININEVSNFLSLPLLNFYIVEENNIKEKYPVGSQYNINIPNDHLQYAITWFSLALALCIFINIFWRKNVS